MGWLRRKDPGGPFDTLLRFFCFTYLSSVLLIQGSVELLEGFDPWNSEE